MISPARRVSVFFSFFMFSSVKRLSFVSGDSTPSLVRFEISGVLEWALYKIAFVSFLIGVTL